MSMSTSTEVIAHHWAFPAIFLSLPLACALMLVGGWFVAVAHARGQNVPFESGIDSVGNPLTPVRQVLSGGPCSSSYLLTLKRCISHGQPSIRESGWVGFVEAAILFLYWQVSGLSGAYWR